MKTILHNIDIKADPGRVYDALATEKGLAGWWTKKVSADIRKGGIIDFTFGSTFNPNMEITELNKPHSVAWKCVDGHEPWQDNKFQFTIEAGEDGTKLNFRQEYARELSDEAYGRYNFNWGYYLESLRQFVETGRGKPYLAATAEDKKSVVRQFIEEYKNRQNPDIVDTWISEQCRVHIPLPGLPDGREGLRINGKIMCSAFPDVQVEREFFIVEGDIVVERAHARATHTGELLGLDPTGKEVIWTELHAYRVENGVITEIWSEADFIGIMVQLGAVEMPGV